MAALKFKGIDVEFSDGVVRTIPPMSLRTVRALETRLAAYQGAADSESIDLVIDASYASLVRNYPELQLDDMQDLIDIGNAPTVMSAVMGVSLLKGGDEPGEAVKPSTGPS